MRVKVIKAESAGILLELVQYVEEIAFTGINISQYGAEKIAIADGDLDRRLHSQEDA